MCCVLRLAWQNDRCCQPTRIDGGGPLYVFLDASGDPGFVRDRSSRAHVTAAVWFKTLDDCAHTNAALDALAREIKHAGEFRYSRCLDAHAEAFFHSIRSLAWSAGFVTFDKAKANWRNPVGDSAYFEVAMVREALALVPALNSADVVIDGVGNDRVAIAAIKSVLPVRAIKSVRYRDSRTSRLVQMADMLAGDKARHLHGGEAHVHAAHIRAHVAFDNVITDVSTPAL